MVGPAAEVPLIKGDGIVALLKWPWAVPVLQLARSGTRTAVSPTL